jgi:hypothetical protein
MTPAEITELRGRLDSALLQLELRQQDVARLDQRNVQLEGQLTEMQPKRRARQTRANDTVTRFLNPHGEAAAIPWIVMDDVPEYLGAVVARLVTDAPTPYILIAQTLAEIHANLPSGLVRSERQPSDPLEVVEIWFPK